MPEDTLNLSEAHEEALREFRKSISDVVREHDTDTILLKWLRARNFNPVKAEIYYREFRRFMEVYEFERILPTYTPPEVAEKYAYTSFLGYAKDGSPVRYNQLGRGDHYGFINSLSAYDLIYYCASLIEGDLELMRKENKRTGKNASCITYIFDFDGFALQDILHKCVIEMLLDSGQMVQDYYPEVWGNMFIINVPPFFDVAFNIVKPILGSTALQKMRLLTRESTPIVLRKYIDEEVLPVFLGGTRVDSMGDPECREFLRFGGKVSPNYYLLNSPSQLSPSDPGVKSLWISARCAFNLNLVARKAGSTIRVQFKTENGSIHLRVLYRELGPDPENPPLPAVDEYLNERDDRTNVILVSPGMRIQSQIAAVDRCCKAPWPGVYIFRFDNSQSWFGSRRLIYKITEIETAPEHKQNRIRTESESEFVFVQ